MDAKTQNRQARLLTPLAILYDLRLRECGPTARGVYWKNEAGQRLRFEVLLGVVDPADDRGGITINDLGCGYGAMFDFLADQPMMRDSRYHGYDISEQMILKAKQQTKDPRANFEESLMANHEADYSFVSGTYNMKLDEHDRDWTAYVEESLADLWVKTRKGLAFNMLCSQTKNRKERDLYYADWKQFRDFCLSELSPHVMVNRDYPLAEWTIYVNR
ncbi:MAG: class I SAM-dependent methyltransferase [Rhodospirillales bacterium]|nr:class I SAM-dependent methyltransferase [Rhodospirillales bacterium]